MAVIWEEKDNSQASSTKGIRILVVIGILLLIAIVAVGVMIAFDSEVDKDNSIHSEENMVADAFSNNPEAISLASQSVVKLNCYDKNGDLYATGSGFSCLSDNVIVTNYHVVEGDVYSIQASTENGHTFDITYVLATDENKDIAILTTAKPHNLPLLPCGDSTTLQKGEKVVAIGSPLGLLNSVSTGVFSGYVKESGMDVLQFTASISSGSSGGALFNDAGEVLGITFASYDAGQNLNLAIPIEKATELYNKNSGISPKTIAEVYNSQVHPIPLYELLQDPYEYKGETICVEGYISTIAWHDFRGLEFVDFYLVPTYEDVWGFYFGVNKTDADYDIIDDEDERRYGFGSAEITWDKIGSTTKNQLTGYLPGDKVILTCEVDIITYNMNTPRFKGEFSGILLRPLTIDKE